jgi:hypothetical protein
MILNALTILHVVLSLIGIGSSGVATYRLLKAKTPGRWTEVFLATTAATSITGFLFPLHGVTPAQVLGVLSLIALIIASLSISLPSQGIWRRTMQSPPWWRFISTFRAGRSGFVPALASADQSEPPFR